MKERYRQGKAGDVEVKKKLVKAINPFLNPLHDQRENFPEQPGLVLEILQEGSRRMHKESEETLEWVRKAMGLQLNQQKIVSGFEVPEPSRVLEGLAFKLRRSIQDQQGFFAFDIIIDLSLDPGDLAIPGSG